MIDNQITIIDNCVSENIQSHIEKILTASEIPWCFNQSTLYVGGKLMDGNNDFPQTPNTLDSPMMTHMAYLLYSHPTKYFDELKPIIQTIPNVKTFLRVKINLTFPTPIASKDSHYPVHVDAGINEKYKTAIYYVNDSDGDTIIFNETKNHKGALTIKRTITPKKGRLVIFDGDLLHAGGFPISSKHRIIINMNFI